MIISDILAAVWRFVWGVLYVGYLYLDALKRQLFPPQMVSIDGETILVTGAVGGIGTEICLHLVRSASNFKLVLWDLKQADIDRFAEELKAVGKGKDIKVFSFAVDISKKENIKAAAKLVKDLVGNVTIIFNNAGLAHMGNFLQLSDKEIEETHDVNLISHLWILREFLPDMVLKNHGRIVTTCSIAGLHAFPFSVPYISSKFGVQGYVESLKLELLLYKYDGIKCTTVYPHFVQTPLIKSIKLNKASEGGLPGPFQYVLKPSLVAMKAVDGMRREYEYVYLPSIMPIAIAAEFFLPHKLRLKIQESLARTSMRFGDEREQKRVFTPYHVDIQNGNILSKEE